MNINGYISEFGKYSFKEKPFNDVDALIFAELAYINFELLTSNGSDSFLIREIPEEMINAICAQQMDEKFNKVMIREMMKSIRYQDIEVKYIKKTDDNADPCQFFAITIFFEDKMYISYRGTDLTLRGWKEDFQMCFLKTVPSQVHALKYLKEVLEKENRCFYVGGHSKGGNLSLYAPLFIDDETNERLITVYSFDGPGFYDNEIIEKMNNWKYKNRISKLMPKSTLVGILLNFSIEGKIVDSNKIGIFQHDPFSWKVNKDGDFKLFAYRLRKSFINEYVFRKWLSEMERKDKVLIINLIFDGFNDLGESIIHLRNDWWNTIRTLFKKYRSYDKKDKKRIRSLIARLFLINRRTTFGLEAFTKPINKNDQ